MWCWRCKVIGSTAVLIRSGLEYVGGGSLTIFYIVNGRSLSSIRAEAMLNLLPIIAQAQVYTPRHLNVFAVAIFYVAMNLKHIAQLRY